MTRRQFANFLRLLLAAMIAALTAHILSILTGQPTPIPKVPIP